MKRDYRNDSLSFSFKDLVNTKTIPIVYTFTCVKYI